MRRVREREDGHGGGTSLHPRELPPAQQGGGEYTQVFSEREREREREREGYGGNTEEDTERKWFLRHLRLEWNPSGSRFSRKGTLNSSFFQALEMIHSIREAFTEILEESVWMDDETKAVAKEKVPRG